MIRVLFVFGTRPEAIKLAPLIRRLSESPAQFSSRVCVTAQHRGLLDQVLDAFAIQPDFDLDLMRPDQSLAETTSRVIEAVDRVLAAQETPDWVIVQGDTTTTFCGALAAFYRGIRVAHVEAGLRTGDLQQPFPEEMNRVLTGRLAALHFAPTDRAREALTRERVPSDRIFVTGNTGIDAILETKQAIESGRWKPALPVRLDPQKKLVLVTAHRRESFGAGIESICEALRALAARDDVEIVYPVHPNPNVDQPVRRLLAGAGAIHLIPPQAYVSFVDLMRRAHLLLTDSGGIQEEAPSLGVPVLVLREKTERPEAVEAGTARLVGADAPKIVREAALLLDDPGEHARRAALHNPFGDGQAALRIREILLAQTAR